MLSAETAAGHYPVEAVTIMNRIIAQVEQDPHYRRLIDAERPEAGATTADAVCGALRSVARTLSLAAVVTYTSSGYTSLRTARERPQAPILSLTPHLTTARRLTLAWGVHSVQTIEINHVTDMVNNACAIAMGENLARPGQTLVIAAGMPFGAAGTTNLLRIVRIKEN
jgi:pyruvate kinase